MAYTINIDSFSNENIRERSELNAAVAAGATSLVVKSTQGFNDDDIIYIGELSREGCEKATVASVDDSTTLTLSAELGLAHEAYSPVTSVLGDKIRIYRAPNVDGKAPADGAFSVLATRGIDPDQPSTYYRDSDGGADYWYRHSYFNETTLDETKLSDPIRGDDFGHYASLPSIRKEAGFDNAFNLADSVIAEQRRQAQAEINGALGGTYTVPFNPVPEIIRTLTVQLAAALLLVDAYGNVPPYSNRLKDVRALLQQYADGEMTIVDDDGNELGPDGVTSYFGEGGHTFRMEDVY